MADEMMTPLRALTIAIAAAIRSVNDGSKPVEIAAEALVLASHAIEHLPEGWVVTDQARIKRELSDVEQKLAEIEGTTRLLLALRLEADGHAKTLGEALRIAKDRERLHQLYPDIPEKP